MTELTEYPNTGQIQVFDIEAISLPVVYNEYGDYDPNGMIYVLRQDSERIRRMAQELFNQPVTALLLCRRTRENSPANACG